MADETGIVRVAYLMSHFPAISHTFLAEEVEQVEAAGIEVVTISVNSPGAVDLLDDANRAWQRRTTYIKGTNKLKVAAIVLVTLLRRPLSVGAVFRLGGWDLRAYLWRFFYFCEAAVVVHTMRRRGCRHLHVHMGGPPSTLAWFAAQIATRPGSRTPWTWSLTVHGWSEFVNESTHHLREKVASAAFVACISDFTRAQLYRLSDPADWPKIDVVRCGIDLTRFVPRPPGADHEVQRILVVGRLSPEKGHVVLVEAAAQLRDRGLKIGVDIVGPDFGMAATIRAAAASAGLADDVVLHGAATPAEVGEFLRVADVFCLPTFAEGLPIVLMEAMACHVPVVTTMIAGIPELAIDGVTALTVPAGNAGLLADALQRMLTDHELRSRLVERAAALVAERHDTLRNVSRLVARFNELCAT